MNDYRKPLIHFRRKRQPSFNGKRDARGFPKAAAAAIRSKATAVAAAAAVAPRNNVKGTRSAIFHLFTFFTPRRRDGRLLHGSEKWYRATIRSLVAKVQHRLVPPITRIARLADHVLGLARFAWMVWSGRRERVVVVFAKPAKACYGGTLGFMIGMETGGLLGCCGVCFDTDRVRIHKGAWNLVRWEKPMNQKYFHSHLYSMWTHFPGRGKHTYVDGFSSSVPDSQLSA